MRGLCFIRDSGLDLAILSKVLLGFIGAGELIKRI